MAQIETASLS
jgi:hypothetical protein